jgi:hypothetical protein
VSETPFQRLKFAFNALLDVAPAEREARLQALAADDAGFVAELRRLLDGLDERDLQPPQAAADPLLGARVGPFELTRRLGAGGMGVVYLGERIDGEVAQQVAIKLPGRLAFADPQPQRIQRERDFLARLAHPHVARLVDAGSSATLGPWFAMEYVDGEPLIHYADHARLDVRARLALWLQVADAVAYAHRHAIVHRDLKPGNVLVDAAGQAKLLDFGIAKFIDPDAHATDTGAIFTARYASPEQVAGEPATIATDVHGLGLLLYELLCGRPAFAGGSDLALRQAIATTDPPSLRATLTGQHADAAAGIAAARQASVPTLHRTLGGDLEAIVGKALRKAPAERYGSVGEFAADVRAWLAGLPVLAVPPSLAYRARKFVRRHRAAVAGAGLAMLGLVVGLGIALQQRGEAVLARQQAVAENDVLLEILRGADPYHERGADLKLGDMLAAATATIARREDLDPVLKARLLVSMGTSSYWLSLNDQAAVALDAARSAMQSIEAPPAQLMLELRLRELALRAGQASVREALVEAIALQPQADRLGGKLLVECWELRSLLHANLREYRESIAALDRAEAVAGPPASRSELRRLVAMGLKRVNLLQFDKRIDAALVESDRVAALAAGMPDDTALAVAVGTSRSDVLLTAGRSGEAAALMEGLQQAAREYFAGRGFRYGRFELVRGRALRGVGRIRDSLAAFAIGVEVYRQTLPGSTFLADALDRQAAAMLRLDEFERAEAAWREAAAIYARIDGADASLARSAAQRARVSAALAAPRPEAVAAALDAGLRWQELPVGVVLSTARLAAAYGDPGTMAVLLSAVTARDPASLVADDVAQWALIEARFARRNGRRDAALAALARMETAIAAAQEPYEWRARAATEYVHWADPATRCERVRAASAAWSAIDPTGAGWARQGIDDAACRG